MPSFRKLAAEHPPILLLDAASSRVQVGLCSGPEEMRWESSDEEAGIGLFRCIEALEVDLDSISAFAFCEGPGSVLGIRTAAMALRTWQVLRRRPVFGYFSLALVSQGLALREASVIADARRGRWHRHRWQGALERVQPEALSGRLVMPENFRHWTPPPPGLERVPYVLAELLPRAIDADLFRAVETPDAFLHEEPQYAIWTPGIHRAP
jgi:tRNA threonylcarbamoyladenosine biosynthesis protein TsaB